MTDYKDLEERLGYHFIYKGKLKETFTHASFANSHQGLKSYDRREFLGDAVLDAIIGEYLYRAYPESSEGDLTVQKAKLVSEKALAKVAAYLRLDTYIQYENQAYHKKGITTSMRADAVEAIIGSLFLEAGFDRTREVVLRSYQKLWDENQLAFEEDKNYKSTLQEFLQKKYHTLPLEYKVKKKKGPSWDPVFYIECVSKGRTIGRGKGSSKKMASQMAAKDALERIHHERKN